MGSLKKIPEARGDYSGRDGPWMGKKITEGRDGGGRCSSTPLPAHLYLKIIKTKECKAGKEERVAETALLRPTRSKEENRFRRGESGVRTGTLQKNKKN